AFRKAGNGNVITDVEVAKLDIRVGKLQQCVFGHEHFVFLSLRCRASTACTTAWITSAACPAAREANTSVTPATPATRTTSTAGAPSLAVVATSRIRGWLNQLLHL